MPRTQTLESRETRISMRVDPERKSVIARAARIRHTTISDFVLEKAYHAASEILAQESQVVMTGRDFARFCRVLDNPPPENLAKMKKLLNTRTVLDE